jgi:hypothetical protein
MYLGVCPSDLFSVLKLSCEMVPILPSFVYVQVMNYVDIIAILPWYIDQFSKLAESGSGGDLGVRKWMAHMNSSPCPFPMCYLLNCTKQLVV